MVSTSMVVLVEKTSVSQQPCFIQSATFLSQPYQEEASYSSDLHKVASGEYNKGKHFYKNMGHYEYYDHKNAYYQKRVSPFFLRFLSPISPPRVEISLGKFSKLFILYYSSYGFRNGGIALTFISILCELVRLA